MDRSEGKELEKTMDKSFQGPFSDNSWKSNEVSQNFADIPKNFFLTPLCDIT